MKKNIILCSVAGVLLIGGIVLIAPMFGGGEKNSSAGRDGIDDSLFVGSGVDDSMAEDPGAAARYMFSDEYRELSDSEKAKYKDAFVDAMSDPLLELNQGSRGRGERGDGERGQRGERGERPEGERPEITDEQRAAFEEMGELRERISVARDEKFFQLEEADQNAVLDHRIERQERWAERRKEMVEWAKANPDNERAQRMLSRMNSNNVATGNTAEHVEESMMRAQRRSPQQRAYHDEIDRRTELRRDELGLGPAPTSGGGGWHGRR